MTEHGFLAAMLAVVALATTAVGYMTYRVHRSARHLEGLMAAIFLEVRKVLSQSR